MIIKIRLLSINDFDICQDLNLDLKSIFEDNLIDELKQIEKESGIKSSLYIESIGDKRMFEKFIINRIFKGYSVDDCQNGFSSANGFRIGAGHPDYKLSFKSDGQGILNKEEYSNALQNMQKEVSDNNVINEIQYKIAIGSESSKKVRKILDERIKKKLTKWGTLPKEVYIEVKWNNDGLRSNQIDWMLDNKETEKIFLLIIKEEN